MIFTRATYRVARRRAMQALFERRDIAFVARQNYQRTGAPFDRLRVAKADAHSDAALAHARAIVDRARREKHMWVGRR